MGLRLGEALNLKIGDIDAKRVRVHIRKGKGRKDRFVTLPQFTLLALRRYWCTHRNSALLFPAGKTTEERHNAKKHMGRGGYKNPFKPVCRDAQVP